MTLFHEPDADHLRRAIGSAHEAREKGNTAFGSLNLAVSTGIVLFEFFRQAPKSWNPSSTHPIE